MNWAEIRFSVKEGFIWGDPLTHHFDKSVDPPLLVAIVYGGESPSKAPFKVFKTTVDRDAAARLFASSLDLLESLEAIVKECDYRPVAPTEDCRPMTYNYVSTKLVQAAKEAIAKAKGIST